MHYGRITHTIHTRYTRITHVLHTRYTRITHALHTHYTRITHALHTHYTQFSGLSVLIDGVTVALPKTVSGVTVKRVGFFITAIYSGFQLKFDTNGQFYFMVSDEYKESLCGLCGDYDDDPTDDFTDR